MTSVKSRSRKFALFVRVGSEGKAHTCVKRCYRSLSDDSRPMTINWHRKHWIVFVALLVLQAFGFWATVQRSGLHEGTLRVPLFFIPVWVIGSVFLTTLIIIEVFNAAFPNGRKSVLSLTVFWLVSVVAGILLWRLIR
jgi:hypothetical protein